jgi:hypothetical protein
VEDAVDPTPEAQQVVLAVAEVVLETAEQLQMTMVSAAVTHQDM